MDWFYYQAFGEYEERYHWHKGDEIKTIDQYGDIGTLQGYTNFFDYDNGQYTYFGANAAEKYTAWQDAWGFYSYFQAGGDGAPIYRAQTFGQLKEMWKMVFLAIAGNTLAASRATSMAGISSTAASRTSWTIGKFSELAKRTGLDRHHLIERRFAHLFDQKVDDMLSILVDPKFHYKQFTSKWRQLIPHREGTDTATKEQVIRAAREVYKNYPELLKALGL